MCGIFGVFSHPDCINLTYLGLFALQHRGQESCGIVFSDGERLYSFKKMGLVSETFADFSTSTKAISCIGHVRYSTAGTSTLQDAQPLCIVHHRGELAIAHNGNLVNAYILRRELEKEGSIFQTTVDSEVILHLLARSKEEKLEDALLQILPIIKGAYSLLLLTPSKLIAIRDPFGFRPLCLGKKDGAYVFSSEDCAFTLIDADFLGEIAPGEMVVLEEDRYNVYKFSPSVEHRYCIFEHIYFARPDSNIFGECVHEVRKKMGAQLAREHPVDADIVVPVPDSGVSAALGYAEESGIPYERALIRNHYVGRTFISPSQHMRDLGVRIKLSPIVHALKGKDVVVIDDSIVRGTTCRKILQMIKKMGARKVHLRISSAPIRYPCFYGIDTPTKDELIAANLTEEEIKHYMDVDSIGYLSIHGMLSVLKEKDYCIACFNGVYPIEAKSEDVLKGRVR